MNLFEVTVAQNRLGFSHSTVHVEASSMEEALPAAVAYVAKETSADPENLFITEAKVLPIHKIIKAAELT